MPPGRKAFKLYKKIAFSCIPILFLLGIAEGLVRITGAAETCPSFREPQLWVCDPLLRFKTNPKLLVNDQKLNSAGFLAKEFEPKPPGVFRILSLGDSCTFGVTAGHRVIRYAWRPYPQRLEKLMAARLGEGKVEVINAGAPGYNSYQGLLLLRTKLRNLEPDLVTVRHGWNDHFASPSSAGGNAFRDSDNPVIQGIKNALMHTALYPFATRIFLEMKALPNDGYQLPPRYPKEWIPNLSVEDYKTALRRIAGRAESMGARVWFLTAPDAFLSDEHLARYEALPEDAQARLALRWNAVQSFRQLMEIHRAYTAATRELAAELEVPLIDMEALYREHRSEKLFSIDDVIHPLQRGYELEAQALSDRLLTSGIVSSRFPPAERRGVARSGQ